MEQKLKGVQIFLENLRYVRNLKNNYNYENKVTPNNDVNETPYLKQCKETFDKWVEEGTIRFSLGRKGLTDDQLILIVENERRKKVIQNLKRKRVKRVITLI